MSEPSAGEGRLVVLSGPRQIASRSQSSRESGFGSQGPRMLLTKEPSLDRENFLMALTCTCQITEVGKYTCQAGLHRQGLEMLLTKDPFEGCQSLLIALTRTRQITERVERAS